MEGGSYVRKEEGMQQDMEIVNLFWERDDTAVELLDEKYGADFFRLSLRIVNNREDAEECVNDAYFHTWTSIPDARPEFLFGYVGRIIRNLSINRVKKNLAKKRAGNETAILLSELQECVSAHEDTESAVEYNELVRDISKFLYTLKKQQRIFFVERYWYASGIGEIAERYHSSYKKVENSLYRSRKKLHAYLKVRGYVI